MFNDAEKYLAKVVPWDGERWINIHQAKTFDDGHKGFPGKPVRTLAKAVDQLRYHFRVKALNDIYVSMGAANEFEIKQNKQRKNYPAALRKRSNVYGIKSLYADLDVKSDAYETTLAALTALRAFCEATTLPLPNVAVLSGTGGVHVYWTLAQTLATEDWQPRANALAAALTEHGVHCDTGCTVDNTRLLRIPETFNAKRDPPLPVKLLKCDDGDFALDVIDAALMPYFGRAIPKSNKPHAPSLGVAPETVGPADVNDELSGGIVTPAAAKRRAQDVASVCPAFKNTWDTHGEHDHNPRWHQMLTLAFYCEEGEALAHELSSSHPSYEHDLTQIEYERVARERAERSELGWTKCVTFQSNGCTECAACQYISAGQSPLNHAPRPIDPSAGQALNEQLPLGYYRDQKNNFIYRTGNDDAAKDPVIPYNIFDACYAPSPPALHFKFHTKGLGVSDVALPLADVQGSEQSFARSLGQQAFVINHKDARVFMKSFIRQLQDQRERVVASQSFGWYAETDIGGIDSFIYAGNRYTPEGKKRAVAIEEALYAAYMPRGVIDAWKQLVGIVNAQKRPALDALIASAFAAPLVRFTGQKGLTLGGWSVHSGVGKTTALMLAAAVWGSPKRSMAGLNDTENHAMGKLGAIRNLPLVWDEIKTHDDEVKFARLMFAITRGLDKGRMRRDQSLAKQGEWETIITYASNVSMKDAVVGANRTTLAGAVRMFEFNVPPKADASDAYLKRQVEGLNVALLDNYGAPGLIYADFLGKNLEKVRTDVGNTMEALRIKVGDVTDDERFWVAVKATVLLGAHYANGLKLTNIDLVALRDFLFDEFNRMRNEKHEQASDLSNEDNVAAIIGSFLADKRARNTVFTDKMWMTKGRPGKGVIKLIYEGREGERIEAIHVHTAIDMQIIRMSEMHFSEWLKHKGIGRTAMLDAMKATLGARRITGGVLGSGTKHAMGQITEPLWELSLAGTTLGSSISWDAPL